MDTPCWVWTASGLPKGYGLFYPAGEDSNVYAHRYAFALAHGEDAGDLHVLHRCDNPGCCNPNHLYAGTRSDNMQEMLSRGRGGDVGNPGESHPGARLTDAAVLEIRACWAAGGVRQRELADRYGVSRALIGKVVRRVAWAHLD